MDELWLIGIGMGSPNHLTREGEAAIRAADTILIPHKGSDKADLADHELTKVWLDHFKKIDGVKAQATSTEERGSIRKLADICHRLVPEKAVGNTVTAMIAGIPNVGKSTIINILAGKKVAKTGNEPAVTKNQQKIHVGNALSLMDTPGVLWPNVENINSGLRLGVLGSVKETVIDYAEIGFFAAKEMLVHYADRLVDRYSLDNTPTDAMEFIEALGRKRGCLGKAGVVDIDRASKIFITELRAGKLGRLTLETPEMMVFEKAALKERIAKKEAERETKKKKRKKKFKERNSRK